MLKEISARIVLLCTEEGGRRNPIASGYRAGMYFATSPGLGNDGIATLLDREKCFPGEQCLARIRPLRPDLVTEHARPRADFELREGARLIGTGVVLEVFHD